MKNKLIGIVVVVLALILVSYFTKPMASDMPTVIIKGETVSKSGKIISIDLEKAMVDGPYLLTIESENGETSTIAVPSMGLLLCAAHQNNNIGDVYLMKVGDEIEVQGEVGESRMIIPCDSPLHYLRPQASIEENFEGEADPLRMNLQMKTWTWVSTLYNDGKEVKPKEPNKFSITFSKDGAFGATTDCNGVGGKYKVNGTQITFSEMISTLMFCEGSQEAEFNQLLTNTSSYHFTSKGELVFDLKFDSGSVIFK